MNLLCVQVLSSMHRRKKRTQMHACLDAWRSLTQHLSWSRQHLSTKIVRLTDTQAASTVLTSWSAEAATQKRLRATEKQIQQTHHGRSLGVAFQVTYDATRIWQYGATLRCSCLARGAQVLYLKGTAVLTSTSAEVMFLADME